MANRWAIATGNKSNPAIWDGGVSVPGAGDVVGANGFTVTIDTDWTITTLTTAAVGSGVAGGGFVLADGVTLTATTVTHGTTDCLTYAGNSPNSATITANLEGGSTGAARSAVVKSGTGNLTINGNITPTNSNFDGRGLLVSGTGGTTTVNGNIPALAINRGSRAVYNTNSGTLTVVGNVGVGSSASTAFAGITNTGTGTVNVTGNTTGGTLAGGNNGIENSGAGNINVTGNALGGSASNAHGITNTGGGTVTIIGTATGGSSATALGVNNGSAGTVNLTGNCVASTGPGIWNNSTGTVIVTGDVIPSSANNGIRTVGAGIVSVLGNIRSDSSGYMGVGCGRMTVDQTNQVYHAYRVSTGGAGIGIERKLYVAGTVQGHPNVADVRYGTVFGYSNEFTGACRIPAVQYVSAGVLVDATTGAQSGLDFTSIGGSTTAITNLKNLYAALETGTAQAGGASTITLRSGASATADYYKDQVVAILSGVGVGQTNRITSYNGISKVATVGTAWATQPDNTSVYVVTGRVG